MAYRCHNCNSPILSLCLGYCAACREPIASEILPATKQQELIAAEREYAEMRDRVIMQREEEKENNRSIDKCRWQRKGEWWARSCCRSSPILVSSNLS